MPQADHTNIPPEERVSDPDTPPISSEEASSTLSTETRSEVPTSLQRSHSMPLGQTVATLHRPASSPGRIGHLGDRSEPSVIRPETHHAAALISLFERDIHSHIPSDLDEDIRLGLKNHFSEVGRRLAEKGETVEDVLALAEKALSRDHLAAYCGGALKEAPGAVAGAAYDLINKVFSKAKEGDNDSWNAAQEGAIGKTIELAADVLSRPFITLRLVPSDGDRYYLAPNLNMLAEPVKRAKEAIGEPGSMAHLSKELGLSYAMRQGFGIGVASASFGTEALSSPGVAGHVENYASNASRVLVGALNDRFQYAAAINKRHFGMFYLFGRKDWETVYDNLKKSPSYDLVKNPALNAALTVLDSVRAPLKTAKAVLGNTFSLNTLRRAVVEIPGGAATAGTRAGVKDAVEYSGRKRLYGDFAGRMVSSVPRAVSETAGEGVNSLYELASTKLKNVCPSSLRVGLKRGGFDDHPV
ncbi:hypothetical protein [Brucella intermedia]|uniref:hypothetical protein n=1 Tax=Brucella intermedia TaxID=94625 RepID=UPI002360ED04|nr:hypothetical protein [Brucella intermedia]